MASYIERVLLINLLINFSTILCYSTDATDIDCSTVTPKPDSVGLQTAENPFRIQIETANERNLTVIISTSSVVTPFFGFLVQAQVFPGDNSTQHGGSFDLIPDTKFTCDSKSSITHSKSFERKNIVLNYNLPLQFSRSIKFAAVILTNFSTFWNIEATYMKKLTPTLYNTNDGNNDEISVNNADGANSNDIDYSGCGATKGCYRYACNNETGHCAIAVTWTDTGDSTGFELAVDVDLSQGDQWTALGLSRNSLMEFTSVTECLMLQNGSVAILMSWNDAGYNNNLLPDPYTSLVPGRQSGAVIDQRIVCKFSHYKNGTADKVFYPDGNYTLIIPTGPVSSNAITYHTAKHISLDPVNLLDFKFNNKENDEDGSGDIGNGEDINLALCGKTKSCFMAACDETGAKCGKLVTWSDGGSYTNFELEGILNERDNYIALGLSTDQSMGDDSVTVCMRNSTGIDIYMSWNTNDNTNNLISDKTMSLVPGMQSGKLVNGKLTCRFSRNKVAVSSNTGKDKRAAVEGIYYPDQPYYLLIANGPVSQNKIEEHSTEPISSGEPLDLTKFDINSTSYEIKSIALMQTHGILMVLAWLVFASFGMLMPRYMKPIWVHEITIVVKKPIWFMIHFFFMNLVFLMVSVAFILIFVYEKSYAHLTPPFDAHPVLGIITMLLTLVNPIMGQLRCEPNARYRWIFNYFHFLVGQGAYFCAYICIYLAMRMPNVNLPSWCLWVLVTHTVWQVSVEILLNFIGKYAASKPVTMSEISLDKNDYPTKQFKMSQKAYVAKTAVMIIHFIVIVGLAAAICVPIGSKS